MSYNIDIDSLYLDVGVTPILKVVGNKWYLWGTALDCIMFINDSNNQYEWAFELNGYRYL